MNMEEWHVSKETLEKLRQTYTKEKDLQQYLLNEDIETYSEPVIKRFQFETKLISNQYTILQIVKIVNVGVPKLKGSAATGSSASSRLLKIVLSDGHSTLQAVEIENVAKLDTNTPPGTKILIKFPNVQAIHKTLLLNSKNAEIIGGKVETLIEKWKVSQSLISIERSYISTENPPPPWIPFGQKISQAIETFKTLKNSESDKAVDEEYEVKREETLKSIKSETKSFARNVKQVRDNLYDVVAAGFTDSQANYALSKTGGSTEAAVKLLKQQQERKDFRRRRDDEDGETSAPHSVTVSLVDFLKVKKEPSLSREPEPEIQNSEPEIQNYHTRSRGHPRGHSDQARGRSQRRTRARGYGPSNTTRPSTTVQQLSDDFQSWPGLQDDSELWPGIEEAIQASKLTANSTPDSAPIRQPEPARLPSSQQQQARLPNRPHEPARSSDHHNNQQSRQNNQQYAQRNNQQYAQQNNQQYAQRNNQQDAQRNNQQYAQQNNQQYAQRNNQQDAQRNNQQDVQRNNQQYAQQNNQLYAQRNNQQDAHQINQQYAQQSNQQYTDRNGEYVPPFNGSGRGQQNRGRGERGGESGGRSRMQYRGGY